MKQEPKEKIIYLQGRVKGYFRQGNSQTSGAFTFSDRILYSADVHDALVISDFDIEEHCVGHFYRPTRHHTLRIFVNALEYTAERVKHFVLRDLVVSEKIILDNEPLIPYEGTILLKLTKPLPPPVAQISAIPADGLSTTVVSPASRSGCFGRPLQLLAAPLRRADYSIEPIAAGSRVKEFLSLFLGGIIMTFLLGGFLSFLGTSSIFSFLLPAVFFASILLHGLFKIFPNLQGHLGIQRPLLNFFAWALILGNLFSMMQHGSHFSNFHGLLLGIALFLLARTGKIARTLGWLLLAFQLIYYFAQLKEALKVESDTKKDDTEYVEPDDEPIETELDSTTVKNENQDTLKLKYRIHRLSWNDNAKWSYSGMFKVRDDFYNISRLKRDQLEINAESSTLYWRKVYFTLTRENDDYLKEVVNEYKQIIKKRQLNRGKAADMVVTSIQNIPYCLVHDLTHEQAEQEYGGFITEWHQTGGPCLELIKFGVQSPTEFMGNFKGDCDTRSIMLYHVLSRLGYNVVVLASDKYGHAILGISGNYRGKYLTFNGLNYYVWETTATGFVPGVLSDECGNMRYWYVALGPKN